MLRSNLLALALAATSLPTVAQVTYKHTGSSPVDGFLSFVVADFNRDGLPDIAFAQEDGLHLIFNAGGGTFSPDKITPGFGGGFSILAVDVNGDQWPDIVLRGTILINNHDGTFTRGQLLSVAQAEIAIVAGDLNGDGKVDLVVPEVDAQFQNKLLQVFLGDGKGSFVAGQTLAVSQALPELFSAELVDLNGDGKLDLMVPEASKVVLWPGKGNGTFGTPSFINNPLHDPVQHPIQNAVAADFNNDGFPDIAVSLFSRTSTSTSLGVNHVFIFRNDRHGHFTQINSFLSGNTFNSLDPFPATLTAGDLNGDGNSDLLFATADFSPPTPKSVYVLGNGDGTFSADHPFFGVNEAVIRDFSLDGRNDVATIQFGRTVDTYVATNGFKNCAPPSSANLAANICAPSTATVGSPLVVRGSGNSPLGVKRVEIWIDGKKAAQKLQDQIAKKFTLTPGTHRIAVVAVDKYLGTATTVKNVTVQ